MPGRSKELTRERESLPEFLIRAVTLTPCPSSRPHPRPPRGIDATCDVARLDGRGRRSPSAQAGNAMGHIKK